jgi:hypothetical protein
MEIMMEEDWVTKQTDPSLVGFDTGIQKGHQPSALRLEGTVKARV